MQTELNLDTDTLYMLLNHDHKIARDLFDRVLENQHGFHQQIDICCQHFNIGLDDLYTKIAHHYDISFFPSYSYTQDISQADILNDRLLLIKTDQSHRRLFLSNPADLSKLPGIQIQYNTNITTTLLTHHNLNRLVNQVKHQKLYALLNQNNRHSSSRDDDIIHCVDYLICDAHQAHASDIHLEPSEHTLHVRFRIDGILQVFLKLPITLALNIASRIKILAKLNISEKRLPQDGRFHVKLSARTLDCRVSCCPTQFGEKTVIRLLNPNSQIMPLERIASDKNIRQALHHACHQPQGLILVTGPTGSGKTQTLYSLLDMLNRPNKNINTVEDPIEITLPGINQTAIKPDIGLTFAATLRSLLRQDPDIIMLGEIRDEKTATIAIRAAQTGHLVLSTLHTNSALQSIQRLINMGIAPYNLANNINIIAAQRLIRTLCAKCKVPLNKNERLLAQQQFSIPPSAQTLYKPLGCELCQQGYSGRTAIFEYVTGSDTLNDFILTSTTAINNKTSRLVAATLMDAAVKAAINGNTSINEISRVLCHA